MTHPIGSPTLVNPTPTTYADAYAADLSNPKKFKDPGGVPNNAAQGITLINGYVSCSSCHAVHFADSDSGTSDGLLNVAGLNPGDGHLLKADGPTKTNKSVICQTCHTYQRHGNPASLEEDVGCLVCHSGHVYNGGTPNFFVLRNTLKTVTFGEKTNALYAPLIDAFLMNKGNGAGFCERCHGVSSALPGHSMATGGTEDRYLQNCKDCHKHNEAGFDFSWKWSGNSNLCGDCHGFPPYLSVAGDHKDGGTKGGYAVMDGASNDSHTYLNSGYYKAEAGTPHKTHAGGGELFAETTDYKFAEGQGACTLTCHDLNSHKQLDNTASFRNMVWGPIAKGNIAPNAVNLNPVYTTTGNGSCATVYCHSNGGTRPAGADRAKISTDFKFSPTAPAWATGDADIIGNATECATFCHGNSTTSMATGAPATNRNNSVSHIKHLAKGYKCNVCHKLTSAVGSTTVVLNTARLAPTGTHVNGKPDVGFDITNDFDQGATGTQLNIIKPASGDNNSGYTAVTGVCYVYCHSDGKAIRTYTNADWDQASTGACGTCHQYYSGAVPTGSGAALSATHAKHFAIAVALTCNDCHGTNASAGTHTGHVDTVFTTVAGSCNTCHGIDGAEAIPQWNAPMSNDYCISCHTGGSFGIIKTAMTAPNKQHATDRGHNRTTNYTSGNQPGNKQCTSCHLTNITNHVNVTDGDATHLVAAATTCTATCHGPAGTASANTRGMVTHVDRVCTDCHDPHGDTNLATNIYMVRSVKSLASTGVGNYSGSAVDFRVKSGANSYDEVDAANADDLCATCHTYGGHPLSTHNTMTNQGVAHNEGTNCFTTCHKTHKEAGGAFINGPGTACNQCHGNPPATGAHWNGILEAHSTTGSIYTDEPRDDCARCHTGAESYTYNVGADQTGGLNHSNKAGRRTILATEVGYQRDTGTNKWSCTKACHVSSKDDGFWYTWDGVTEDETTVPPSLRTPVGTSLACTACHYYDAAAPSSANNNAAAPRDLKGSHNAHFTKSKQCAACHDVPIVGTTTHITTSGATDKLKIEGRAAALQDEAATVTEVNITGGNSCSGSGVALGCHNTKATPAWGAGSITCTNCHVVTGSATADPKTGLHNIGVTEAAAGVQPHDSTLPGGGCTACHNSTKPPSHTDGFFNNDTAVRIDRFLTARVGLTWTDNATANRGTCAGTGGLAGCHSDGGNWTRLWSTEANSTGTASGIARCNVCHGQFSTLSGSAGRGWNAGTSHFKTYGGATSTRGVSHKSQAGENNACEDCHSYTTLIGNHDTTATGGYKVTMNDDVATVTVTESGGRAWCAACHHTDMIPGDPLTSGTYAFTQSVFQIQRVAGANDPKQECNNCHGDGTGRYWPMGIYGAGNAANDVGRHEIHMTRLTKSVYNQTVVELLADGDVKNKQIELCKYCHNATVPGTNPGHNDSALPAEVASTMYALWDTTRSTADAVTYTGTGANGTGTCANSNCHNGKNTNSVANFTWHGTGTQNCLLCHNDITVTTGGTTGATHAAHTASAATFGKDINCTSCHGGSPSWSAPYAVAAATAGNSHIDGQFKVGTAADAAVSFNYGGTYTNAATRVVGDCSINLCHNNGKNLASYRNGGANYNWQTAFTGCSACHRTDVNLGGNSHTAHLLVPGFANTFGKAANCQDCHDAASAVSMAGKTLHMDGFVTLAVGLSYSGAPGTLNVTNATVGACNGSCHTNGKGADPVTFADWNTPYTNCNICHALPNTAGNDGARHVKHVGNTAKVAASCGECHLTATTTTYNSANHLNGTVNTGNKISDHTAGTATCTNSCHLVDSVRGDWLDTAALACTDCHQVGSSYIGEAAKPLRAAPNGLHKALSAKVHNQTLAGGCNACHTTMTIDSPPTHVNGVNNVNTAYGLFTPNYNTTTGTCYTTCHDDGGDWARKWIGVVDAKPLYTDAATAAVCGNCHGSFAQGWRFVNEAGVSTTDHTDPDPGNTGDEMNTAGHQVCSKCHGWGVAAYQSATKHQNSNLTMNSELGYDDGTGGCTTNCHTPLTLTMQSNSGFLNDSGAYGALSCGSCHDDGVIPPNSGAHVVSHGADADTDYSECIACHGDNGDGYTGMTPPHNNGTVNFAAGITYSDGGTPGTNAAALNDTCTTSQCHSAVGNPATWGTPASVGCNACHYYEAVTSGANNTANANALTATHTVHFNKGKLCTDCHGTLPAYRTHIAPKTGTDGVVLTLKANAAQNDADPVSRASMTWDDGLNTCGTAGALGCHNTKTTPAWGTTNIACTACHVVGGGAAADPATGLHNMTATNVQKHNGTLKTGCTECHATMANDPASHIDGTWLADSSTNQIGAQPRFLTFPTRTGTVYAEGVANASTCWDNNTSGLDYNAGAGCHRDNGVWKRQWSTNANVDTVANPNPGQLVCDVCHGQYQSLNGSSTGWREGSVHYRSGADGALENKGVTHNRVTGVTNACQDCHAYASAAPHENGVLNFDGLVTNNPDTFTLTMGTTGWYCATCHNTASGDVATLTTSHTFPDSTAFTTRAYVAGTSYPEGGCTGCHGNAGNGSFWPDGSTGHAANTAGVHADHVREIAKKLYATGSPSVAQQNLTCNYCHPGNTHGGVDAALPADVGRTDTANDGTPDLELATPMKKIIGGTNDTNGFWRRTPGTCSNVACHARSPFTPHWYGDTVAPGQITDLALKANTEPGTVKLEWNAPGDDGYLDGTAYRYDVRWSTASITEGNFASANQALAPTVRRQRNSALPDPKNQEVILKGLPAGTLYFAVKTADERYPEAAAWSLLSNVVSGTATTDNVAPSFWGINAVSSNDYNLDLTPNPDTNSVNVSWDAGSDHSHSLTTPLNYLVLWSEYSLRTHFTNAGPMPATIGTDSCFDKTDVPLLPVTCGSTVPLSNEYRIKSAQTTALNYDVKNLPVGTVYNFLVRSKDLAGNIDSNRAELMAMAKTTAYQTIALQTKLTSAVIPAAAGTWTGLFDSPTGITASNASLGDAYPVTAPGTFSLGTTPVIWSPTTTYTQATNVWGLSYQIKITGGNAAVIATYQFGYLNGTVFTGFGAPKTLTIGKKLARVYKFPLSTYKGKIPAGSKPAFILKAASSVTLSYGSTLNKGGILLFNQQDYNDLPTGLGSLSQSQVNSTFIGGNLYRLTWTAASAVNGGQSVHYDVFGSIDGGVTYPYTIGRNLTTNSVDWDPVGDGITGNQTNVKFKVLAGDEFRSGNMLIDGTTANNVNHSELAYAGTFTVNNTVDIWTPAAIGSAIGTADDLKVETRPKQGSVALSWKAVGNDGFNHGTRATQYDIRFNTVTINDANWAASTLATNEPYPDFTGAIESYELLGLNPDAPYYFAMKVGDAIGNWSPISNVASTQSGPKCGICHSTPPDESATAGNHIEHGYTMADCAKCHGTEAATFTTAHQDGALKLGWNTATPTAATTLSGTTITYTQGGNVIYTDTNGAGGFVPTPTVGDGIDSGTCSGFAATNTSGCHGPAAPAWTAGTVLDCSACHGTIGRTTDQYSRAFDATIDNGMVVPDQVKASPAVDNHGGSTGKYVGAHLKHLNSSFRLAKGDNCKLCHNNSIHADGLVDVAYDLNVTGAGALWTPNAGGAGTPGTCGGTNVDNCHGSNVPQWDTAATVACNQCHGFAGMDYTVGNTTSAIGHVKDGTTVRACIWCHPAGHPQGTVQDPNSIMIPNNPLVGIAYRSGGIHLLKNINSRGIKTTEAEVCWACHDAQATKVTEWGANNDTVTGSTPYNYGDIFTDSGFTTATSNWFGAGTGAYWRSGTTAFQTIKKGRIQSTHSTAPGATSTVAYDGTNKRYNETLDAVADIRCSNCHDVHNMNKAPNDAVSGTPYLRGTWMGNPYNEDGPPLSTTTYVTVTANSHAGFGAVPRGGTGYRRLGGYFIDQNNVVPMTASATVTAALDEYPTAGWTQESSAGLCILCHGNDVDNMDQKTGEALWLGTNGHSNSAIGGTFTNNANIFDAKVGTTSLSGRPVPVNVTATSYTTAVPDMAYQSQGTSSCTRGYGYRNFSGATTGGGYTPAVAALYAYNAYDWGATVDADTIDQMYHQFSCSKCHNPHASRLPKLLITNCLDVQHNTWDDNKSLQATYTATTLRDVDKNAGGTAGYRSAYYASAQNCHRYNDLRTAANKGGWNKVSPWTTANQ